MNRSRSRNRLIETAFVGTCSSTEDLDEVDRLANHPVLRSVPLSAASPCGPVGSTSNAAVWQSNLRKSMSETGSESGLGGGGTGLQKGRGLSIWSASNGAKSTEGSPNSSYVQTRKGFRATIASKLSRSTTINCHLSASPANSTISAPSSWIFNAGANRAKSAPSTPPKWIEIPPPSHQSHANSAKSATPSSHHVVRAVIESSPLSSVRDCLTPTLSGTPRSAGPRVTSASLSQNKTPPNTAPLPCKFGRKLVPQNLLKLQHSSQTSCDSSSSAAGSNNEIFVDEISSADAITPAPPSNTNANSHANNNNNSIHPAAERAPTTYKMPPSLRARLRLDEDCMSSSAESTPQRRPHLTLPTTAIISNPPLIVKRGTEVSTKPHVLAPKPTLDLNNSKSKFFSSGESSCSSAMSSLESIRSNNSDGVQSLMSSESGAVSSMSSQSSEVSGCIAQRPSLELTRPGKVSSKFQVLSPISDKSQEQYSEASKTPKVSPTTLTSIDNGNNSNNNNNNNLLLSMAPPSSCPSGNDNDMQKALDDVPWDMPKLKRRLQNKGAPSNNLNNRILRGQVELRGSDSGISMASQDVQEIKDLLNVPWDMPKLRKRTEIQQRQQQAGWAASGMGTRPLSVPTSFNMLQPPESKAGQEVAVPNFPENQNAGNLRSSEVMDNLVLPAPPPGFEDSSGGEEEFYFGKDDLEEEEDSLETGRPTIQMRRPLSGMTNFNINNTAPGMIYKTFQNMSLSYFC